MRTDTVFYLFDPNSPGWIIRRLEKGDFVSAEDVARVARLHPECMSDPRIIEHTLQLLEGKVKKRRGRRPASFGRQAQICMAGMLVEEQVAEWRQGVGDDRPKKMRGGKGLTEAAYDKIGGPLGLSGRALANAVSALK